MTFIGYPDITATSDNGEWRLAITGSPGEYAFRNQGDFVYRLYKSDRLIWERRSSEWLEDFPHEAWVSDDGWVVVRIHEWFHAGLFVLSPEERVTLRRLHCGMLEEDEPGFLEDDAEEYAGWTSAGPFWSQSSIGYFIEHGGRPCWVIRTWWGRRVAIDLVGGKILDPSVLDDNQASSHERSLVQSALANGIAELEAISAKSPDHGEDTASLELYRSIITATYHSGRLHLRDAIPYLRRLEKLPLVSSSAIGPVTWAVLHTLRYRQAAKLSLLRLDQEPLWLSHYQLELHSVTPTNNMGTAGEMFRFPAQASERNVDQLQPGRNQMELLLEMGAPDFIDRQVWEYDFFSSNKAFTARVHWDDSHLTGLPYETYKAERMHNPPRIDAVDVVEPVWKGISPRDRDITD